MGKAWEGGNRPFLFCLPNQRLGTEMLHFCYDTIPLSTVVNVMNVMTRENRGAKSLTPDAISGT